MDSSTSHGPRLLAALAAGLAIAGTFVAVLPPASAADMCSADNLYVVKGRLEGAAGNRYLTVRLTNVGDDACSAGTATKAGFRDWSGALGVKGVLSAGSGAVTLAPGETATTVIHWTDPGPVPRRPAIAPAIAGSPADRGAIPWPSRSRRTRCRRRET